MDSTNRFYGRRLTPSSAKRPVIAAVLMILILTFLGFPPLVGIETRPRSNVSTIWLAYFVFVLIVETSTIPMIYRRPSLGGRLGILAASLNILFVLAGQVRLLQPEVASLSYSVLQSMTVIASLALAYFSCTVSRTV
jgi:hypothetical protein